MDVMYGCFPLWSSSFFMILYFLYLFLVTILITLLGEDLSWQGTIFSLEIILPPKLSLLLSTIFLVIFLSIFSKLSIFNHIFYCILHMDTFIGVMVMTFMETKIFGLIYSRRFSYQVRFFHPNFLKLCVNTLFQKKKYLRVFKRVQVENLYWGMRFLYSLG